MRVAHARRAARRPPSSVSGSSGWLWRRPPSAGTVGSESLASVSVPAAGKERWPSRRLGNKYTSGVRSLPYPLCLRHFLLPSFLSPFFFFFRGFACEKPRDASTESILVDFCVLWFGLVCSVSQEPFGTWLWNSLSWISPPRGGLRTAVRVADLGAAPAGPPRPWQAGCTTSVLVCRKTHFYPLASQREKHPYRGR